MKNKRRNAGGGGMERDVKESSKANLMFRDRYQQRERGT